MRSVRVALSLVVVSALGSIDVADVAAQAADPAAAVACQAAIGKHGTAFVGKKLKLLDACRAPIFKCLQTVPEDFDAEVDPLERCLEKADKRCLKTADKIVAEAEKLFARIVGACAPLTPAQLFDEAGVGFDALVAECAPLVGVRPSDVTGIAQCVVFQYECQVERLFQAEHPRAGELFFYTEADIGGTCLEDLGSDGSVEDPKLGKAVDKCAKTVGVKSAAFAVRKMKAVVACTTALVGCAAADPSDACREKARLLCDKELGAVATAAAKLAPAYEKACGKVAFTTTLAPGTGLGTDGLAAECDGWGLDAIGSLAAWGDCIQRNHECETDELLRFAAPRAAELLEGVGRTLPGQAYCTPVEEE